jgi:hypothetical protein
MPHVKLTYIYKKVTMKKVILTSTLLILITLVNAQNDKKEILEQEIKKLSNDWMTATMNRDEKTLNKIVAAEFKLGGTDPDNPTLQREIWMKNTLENLKIDSINYIKMKVDVIDNVAIVQAILYWSVSFQDMPAKKDTVNLMDTWIRRNKVWQVVNRLVVE